MSAAHQRDSTPTIWTIGHSTHPWSDFVDLLQRHGIEAVADVRRFPGSRRHPWFASETMAAALPVAGIDYQWLPELGGRRAPQPGSPNDGWDNKAFQGYADHMYSVEFAEGWQRLQALAGRRRAALMCAEAPWWRCHRRMISDLLVHRGHPVLHIMGLGEPRPHPLNPLAQARGADLVYPAAQGDLFAPG